MASPQSMGGPQKTLRVLGSLNIAFGLLVMPVNVAIVGLGIAKLQSMSLSIGAIGPLWIAVATYLAAGLVLAVAGFGLCRPAPWGRWLSLLGVGMLYCSVLIAALCVNIAFERARQEYQGPLIEVAIGGGIPGVWPGYGAVLLVLLNSPAVRNWARGNQSETGGGEVALSKLAAVTMMLALMPIGGVTQAAALFTGCISLINIRNARGKLTGAALALTGIVLSVLILAGCIAWLVLSRWGTGTAISSMFLTSLGGLLALFLVRFLVNTRNKTPSAAIVPVKPVMGTS